MKGREIGGYNPFTNNKIPNVEVPKQQPQKQKINHLQNSLNFIETSRVERETFNNFKSYNAQGVINNQQKPNYLQNTLANIVSEGLKKGEITGGIQGVHSSILGKVEQLPQEQKIDKKEVIVEPIKIEEPIIEVPIEPYKKLGLLAKNFENGQNIPLTQKTVDLLRSALENPEASIEAKENAAAIIFKAHKKEGQDLVTLELVALAQDNI